jgi:glycerophosphoryl diester phosphodiesterase
VKVLLVLILFSSINIFPFQSELSSSDTSKAFYKSSHASRVEEFMFNYRRELLNETEKTILYNAKKILSIIPLIPLWFYEYFRFCPDEIDISEDKKEFYVIGHRGAPTIEPENTIPSFKAAMEKGANGIETDVCITKDSVVILWHDWSPTNIQAILRDWGFEPEVEFKPYITSDPEFVRPVNELTYEEFVKHYSYEQKGNDSVMWHIKIPTLEDLFKWGVNEKRLKLLSLDLKIPYEDSTLADVFIAQLIKLKEKYNPEFKIIIETTIMRMAMYMANNFDDLIITPSIEPHGGWVLDPSEYSVTDFGLMHDMRFGVAIKPRDITFGSWTTFRRTVKYDLYRRRQLIREGKEDKIQSIFGATINDEAEMECLIRMGIDGLQTDYPEKLRKAAEKYGKVFDFIPRTDAAKN